MSIVMWIIYGLIALCFFGIAFNLGAYVEKCEHEGMLEDWNNPILQKMAISELSEILYCLQTNIDDLHLDPEERETLLLCIDDFHDLIIEDCIRFGKCEILDDGDFKY